METTFFTFINPLFITPTPYKTSEYPCAPTLHQGGICKE